MGENRKLQLQLCDVEREFPEHYLEHFDVSKAKIYFKKAQKVPRKQYSSYLVAINQELFLFCKAPVIAQSKSFTQAVQ